MRKQGGKERRRYAYSDHDHSVQHRGLNVDPTVDRASEACRYGSCSCLHHNGGVHHLEKERDVTVSVETIMKIYCVVKAIVSRKSKLEDIAHKYDFKGGPQ